MGKRYRNIHGRRSGRGIRPYLLTPKLLAVSVYFGGLVIIIAGSTALIVLARLKPRLGQNWARTYRSLRDGSAKT